MAIKELREATSPKANKEILDVSFCCVLRGPQAWASDAPSSPAGLRLFPLSHSGWSRVVSFFSSSSGWYKPLSGLLLRRRLAFSILPFPRGWGLAITGQLPGPGLSASCVPHMLTPVTLRCGGYAQCFFDEEMDAKKKKKKPCLGG